MYSKELAQLDHNTAEYMVDEMQKDLDEARSIFYVAFWPKMV